MVIVNMTILNMLDPKTFAAAKSAAFNHDAVDVVTNSGSDVAPARRSVPTHTRPHPVRMASVSAAEASPTAAATTTTEAQPKISREMPSSTSHLSVRIIAILAG